jgi:hypothetical protein
MEPQAFPDAPHHPNLPFTVLRPDDIYRRIILPGADQKSRQAVETKGVWVI